MHTLMIGVAVVAALITISISMYNHNTGRHRKHDSQWLERHGKRVLALVTNVQVEQDWKYEDRYQLNQWNGVCEQVRTWQPCAIITTLWTDPQTQRNYTFTFKVWSKDEAQPFLKGREVPVLFDSRHPERYTIDAQSAYMLPS